MESQERGARPRAEQTRRTTGVTEERRFRRGQAVAKDETITRERLIELLNEDLAREYQAIISYVIYSKVLKGAAYMNIAAELEKHAGEELQHALTISEQIDYFGGQPTTKSKAVRTSDKAEEMLRFDLENENETVRNYRDRVRQAEALGEYALAEDLRQILVQEQDHQISLATALGIDVPKEGLGRASGKATPVAG
jgi:bacterioferritin